MSEDLTFWQHLDALRSTLIRCAVAILGCGIIAFCLKDYLFRLILAPTSPEFFVYRFFPAMPDTPVSLINTGLAQQFIVHMQTALAMGALLVSPYLLYELFRFISPALYDHERRIATRAVGGAYFMFLLGVLLNYCIIFPFTFTFLGTYQVSSDVPNLIDLSSYISTLLMMSLIMGIVFELPILCWILSRMHLLTSAPMRLYRRHAIVAIVILSAVITPTGDAFTLALVSVPIYLLYEFSILIVRRTESHA